MINIAAIEAALPVVRQAHNLIRDVGPGLADPRDHRQRAADGRAAEKLAEHLIATAGGSLSSKWDGAVIKLAGIRSTSTSGKIGALSNWIIAAKSRLGQ